MTDLSEDVICEKLTVGVNSCGLKFNTDTGAPAYIENPTVENGNLVLNLYGFNKDYTSEPKSMPENGCSSLDCSLLLTTLARLYGIKMDQITLSGGTFNQGFYINRVQPIGFDEWMQPFANTTNQDGFLSYHCVAVRGDSVSSWYDLKVYDSCFKLDDGTGNALLPVKKELGCLNSEQKVVIQDKISYRGQLVKQGEINYVSMPVTTTWELRTEKPEEPNTMKSLRTRK